MKTLLSLFMLMLLGIGLGSCSRTQETSLPNAHAQDVSPPTNKEQDVSTPTDKPNEDISVQSSDADSLAQTTDNGSEKEDSDVERIDGLPAEMQPWRDPNNRNVQILDEGWDAYYERRDLSQGRQPGPINLQRYKVLPTKHAFPTYMGLPVALTTEDLKAGEVDVAIVGLPSSFNPAEGGTGWAANYMRINRTYDFAETGHDTYLNNHYFEVLNVVDYGNANAHPSFMVQNFADQALVLKEILEGGAIPMAIGGDHGTQVASIMAVVDHFGPKEVAFVHFDAHLDLAGPGLKTLGVFTHGGRARRFAHEKGWIDGKDMHSIGLRSPYDESERIEWMRQVGDQYHFMAEFERRGFDKVWKDIKQELKGKKLYISVDIDVMDASAVPGASNPEPGGFTTMQMITMIRELAIQNEVVLIDFCEYSPLLDDAHFNTGNVINRLMRSFMAGLAARKEGITDPSYIAPEILDHN